MLTKPVIPSSANGTTSNFQRQLDVAESSTASTSRTTTSTMTTASPVKLRPVPPSTPPPVRAVKADSDFVSVQVNLTSKGRAKVAEMEASSAHPSRKLLPIESENLNKSQRTFFGRLRGPSMQN